MNASRDAFFGQAGFGKVSPPFTKQPPVLVPIPRALSRHLSLATTSGVLVLSVEKDSPAEKAGVLEGNVIVGMDGVAIQGVDDLHADLTDQKIGAESQLTVIRRTTKITLHVFPEEMRPVA